ncbi:CD109 antigen-like isoform X2 [Ruditapes philippinarum]|uniref:CD109 antigen-like isoform X2 n=1 Tax=Ruditapes philippinarum TaxID=129788 RepID=UPI00295A7E88|nr:CD109 antigen-like isoform X2 [Ruditapes philippinarum]
MNDFLVVLFGLTLTLVDAQSRGHNARLVTSRNSGTIEHPGSYMALFPTTLHNSDFSIYFKLLKPVAYETVEARLLFSNYSDSGEKNVTKASGSLSLSSGTQEGTINIKVPGDLDNYGRYDIYIRGSGIFNFENITRVYPGYRRNEKKKSHNIFIQTDKAAYKSGQKVRYRVFVVDRDMKPMDEVMTISIMDPKSNKIKEHVNVSGLYGFSGEMSLSKQPVLGYWAIRVNLENTENVEERISFEVQEYVLPKYEVKVKLPPFGTVANPELKGSVTAKYTYGKPVKGHVTLRVSKGGSNWWFFEPRAIQTEFKIDGEADFSIATDTLLKFDPSLKYDTLTVEANVTEDETGEIRVARSTITFHERPLKLEFLSYGDDSFKPEFKYTTYIKITQPDGRPLTQSGDRVRIGVTYFTDKETGVSAPVRPPNSPSSNLMEFLSPFPDGNVIFMPEMFLSVPRDGIIKLELDIPVNVATGHIDVKLKDEKISKNIQRFRTASKSYLHLEMKSSFVKVGKQAEFSVRSNVRPNGKVTYHIIKNGRIIQTHFTHIASVYQKNTFYVTMTSEMVPDCILLAYYYNDKHSEIIADAITFTVDMHFQNDVSLKFDRTQVSPGTNVSLNIRADPGSQVFILAVDKSVILHKTGNDITEKRVYNKLGVYERPGWKYQDSYLYGRVSSNDVVGIFNNVGLSVITDALLHDFNFMKLQMEINSRNGYFVTDIDSIYESSPNPCSPGSKYSCECPPPFCTLTTTVRKDFPETWIWSNTSVSSTGNVVMTATVPDTITDWVATGYALNAESGLGVAPVPANVTAYLPFFVSLHLPFSIVSGEVAVIQALVFNYYPHDMYVTVSLKNSSEEFLGITVNRYGKEEETKDRVKKCILVKSNDAHSAYFTIKAQKTGTITLEVEASSPRGRDTVIRQLIVRPPGQQEENNVPVLISLDNGGNFEKDVPVIYPLRIVPDSQRIQITVIGDMFGPSMDHLDQLIKIPYGCGEQNMVRFAPAVFAAKYLKVTNRYSDAMKERVEYIMETGYQRQLTYQRHDGSFSAFGYKDNEGSLWLTAFVLKSFAEASEFTYIDPAVIEKGVRFILEHQKTDGSFNSTGFVHNKAMQGGSVSSSRSLAAYVLIAMNEVQSKNIMRNVTEIDLLKKSILSATGFIQQGRSRLTGDYEIAITAYASAQSDPADTTDLLTRLDRSSRMVESDGTKRWKNEVRSIEIETAGYALLAYAKQNNINGALPVLKWLVQQRSPYGGFISTQDTVVALQALSNIASQMYTSDVSMTVSVDYGSESPKNVTINPENMDVLQFIDVPEESRTLRISATGRGTGLVEVSTFYNILEEERNPSFDLMVTTNGTEVDRFTLKVCTRWLDSEDSGMVLLDIGFPSGYKPIQPSEEFWLREKKNNAYFSRQELEHGRLILYYDYLDEEIACQTIDVVRETTVGRVQPASVRVYSYYNTEKSAMKFYLPNVLKKNYICDFCGIECGCGFDPEAVPMERCTGIMSNYRSITRPLAMYPGQNSVYEKTVVYPGQTSSSSSSVSRQTVITPGESPMSSETAAIYPGMRSVSRSSSSFLDNNRIIYPAVPNTEVHRVIQPIGGASSVRTIHRQRLQPNRWHRGQTIPVSFSRTTKLKESFPTLINSFPTISRSWHVNRT